jgi:hypothetical protein
MKIRVSKVLSMKHFKLLFSYLCFPLLLLRESFTTDRPREWKKKKILLLPLFFFIFTHSAAAANQAPTADDKIATTQQNIPVTITVSGSDPDNGPDSLTYQIVNSPSHGQLSGAEPTITYTPESDFNGTDVFTYRAYDGEDYSAEATVIITVEGSIHVDDVPVCIESLTYGTASGDLVTPCFNPQGIFQGGPGCLQRIKLRNLSDQNITNSQISIDYSDFNGVLNNSCEIDKVDESGSDCNVSTIPKIAVFNPYRSFEQYRTHTLALGIASAVGDSTPFDGNITINYTQNGLAYTGTLQKCQIESEFSEDLCYDSVTTNGSFCVDRGFISGGLNCTTTINLRNQGGTPLFSPTVDIITDALFDGHFIDDCGIDNNSTGDCTDSNVLDMGFMGMSGMGMARGVTYDPMPDFDSNETHSAYTNSLGSLDVFSHTTLIGTYVKDGRLYHGEIQACDPCTIVQWQKDEYTISEDYQNPMPPSKTVNAVIELKHGPVDFDINVTYSTVDGTAIGGDSCPSSGIYDYISKTGTVLIHAGESNITVPIQVCNDAPIELDEHFFIDLSDPVPAGRVCLNDHNRTKVTILAQEDSPVCFNDNFDSPLDSLWRVLDNPNASGHYTPQVVNVNGDGRLRLTDREHNLATVVTKDYTFNTQLNLIIVEFDYYNYGGCQDNNNYHEGNMGNWGADGIVNVLFNSNKPDGTPLDSPIPGGIGGSLGYAQMKARNPNQDGFEGGWLGLGLDEFGNFARANEGKEGGITPDDRTINAVSIRGDGSGLDGYEYLAGTTTLNPPLANKLTDPIPEGGYYAGRFKFTVDARDPAHLYIKLERDIDGNESGTYGYETIIDQFDAKAPGLGQGPTPEKVRYAITSGTGGGCNFHELSWIELRGNCEVYAIAGNYVSGPFAALDDYRWNSGAPKDPDDFSISTKDAGREFSLVIASMNTNHDHSETKANTDVKFGIYSPARNQNDCGGEPYCSRSTIRDFNASIEPYLNNSDTRFIIDEAYNNMHVRIFYCGDYNETSHTTALHPLSECGISDNNPENFTDAQPEGVSGHHLFYHESDHFAVKPTDFEVTVSDINTTLTAGKDLNITFQAIDTNSHPVFSFNESAGETFLVDINESKPNCITGSFYDHNLVNEWRFLDGNAIVLTHYNEVGNIFVRIFDTNLSCTERYAHIDCNDKNISGIWDTDIDTAIGEDSIALSFLPDHFALQNVVLRDHHESVDSNFTYLASTDPTHDRVIEAMVATLSMDVVAQTEDNTTTSNYNKECYAEDITSFSIGYKINNAIADTVLNPGILTDILYRWHDDSIPVNDESSNADLGESLEMVSPDKQIFNTDHNGTAKLAVQLNFDRTYKDPVNPFILTVTDINITDTNGIRDKNDTMSMKAHYLYARTKPNKLFYDNITTNTIKTPVGIVVYCDLSLTECQNRGMATITYGPLSDARSNEAYWWFVEKHGNIAATSDGEVRLTATDGGITPAAPTAISPINGIDKSVTVSNTNNTTPNVVKIDFGANTNYWLIYNKDADSIPSPLYEVRFIGTSGWTGKGKTGHVVGDDINTKKAKRLEW